VLNHINILLQTRKMLGDKSPIQ